MKVFVTTYVALTDLQANLSASFPDRGTDFSRSPASRPNIREKVTFGALLGTFRGTRPKQGSSWGKVDPGKGQFLGLLGGFCALLKAWHFLLASVGGVLKRVKNDRTTKAEKTSSYEWVQKGPKGAKKGGSRVAITTNRRHAFLVMSSRAFRKKSPKRVLFFRVPARPPSKKGLFW